MRSSSWQILSDSVVIKRIDKSFMLHEGTSIPKEILDFFSSSTLKRSEQRDLVLNFKGTQINAYIQLGDNENPYARMFWRSSNLSRFIKEEYPDYDWEAVNAKNYDKDRLPFISYKKFEEDIFFIDVISNTHIQFLLDIESFNKENEFNFKSQNDDLHSDINEINNSNDLTDTEKNTLIKARIGQGEFRRNVIQTWGLGESCPVTKISTRELLVASHIKPWRECKTKDERLDGANGILLCSNIDKLFDSHLISFKNANNDYKICFNNKLNEQELNEIGITKSLQLDTDKLDSENRERLRIFLEGHFLIFSQKNK